MINQEELIKDKDLFHDLISKPLVTGYLFSTQLDTCVHDSQIILIRNSS